MNYKKNQLFTNQQNIRFINFNLCQNKYNTDGIIQRNTVGTWKWRLCSLKAKNWYKTTLPEGRLNYKIQSAKYNFFFGQKNCFVNTGVRQKKVIVNKNSYDNFYKNIIINQTKIKYSKLNRNWIKINSIYFFVRKFNGYKIKIKRSKKKKNIIKYKFINKKFVQKIRKSKKISIKLIDNFIFKINLKFKDIDFIWKWKEVPWWNRPFRDERVKWQIKKFYRLIKKFIEKKIPFDRAILFWQVMLGLIRENRNIPFIRQTGKKTFFEYVDHSSPDEEISKREYFRWKSRLKKKKIKKQKKLFWKKKSKNKIPFQHFFFKSKKITEEKFKYKIMAKRFFFCYFLQKTARFSEKKFKRISRKKYFKAKKPKQIIILEMKKIFKKKKLEKQSSFSKMLNNIYYRFIFAKVKQQKHLKKNKNSKRIIWNFYKIVIKTKNKRKQHFKSKVNCYIKYRKSNKKQTIKRFFTQKINKLQNKVIKNSIKQVKNNQIIFNFNDSIKAMAIKPRSTKTLEQKKKKSSFLQKINPSKDISFFDPSEKNKPNFYIQPKIQNIHENNQFIFFSSINIKKQNKKNYYINIKNIFKSQLKKKILYWNTKTNNYFFNNKYCWKKKINRIGNFWNKIFFFKNIHRQSKLNNKKIKPTIKIIIEQVTNQHFNGVAYPPFNHSQILIQKPSKKIKNYFSDIIKANIHFRSNSNIQKKGNNKVDWIVSNITYKNVKICFYPNNRNYTINWFNWFIWIYKSNDPIFPRHFLTINNKEKKHFKFIDYRKDQFFQTKVKWIQKSNYFYSNFIQIYEIGIRPKIFFCKIINQSIISINKYKKNNSINPQKTGLHFFQTILNIKKKAKSLLKSQIDEQFKTIKIKKNKKNCGNTEKWIKSWIKKQNQNKKLIIKYKIVSKQKKIIFNKNKFVMNKKKVESKATNTKFIKNNSGYIISFKKKTINTFIFKLLKYKLSVQNKKFIAKPYLIKIYNVKNIEFGQKNIFIKKKNTFWLKKKKDTSRIKNFSSYKTNKKIKNITIKNKWNQFKYIKFYFIYRQFKQAKSLNFLFKSNKHTFVNEKIFVKTNEYNWWSKFFFIFNIDQTTKELKYLRGRKYRRKSKLKKIKKNGSNKIKNFNEIFAKLKNQRLIEYYKECKLSWIIEKNKNNITIYIISVIVNESSRPITTEKIDIIFIKQPYHWAENKIYKVFQYNNKNINLNTIIFKKSFTYTKLNIKSFSNINSTQHTWFLRKNPRLNLRRDENELEGKFLTRKLKKFWNWSKSPAKQINFFFSIGLIIPLFTKISKINTTCKSFFFKKKNFSVSIFKKSPVWQKQNNIKDVEQFKFIKNATIINNKNLFKKKFIWMHIKKQISNILFIKIMNEKKNFTKKFSKEKYYFEPSIANRFIQINHLKMPFSYSINKKTKASQIVNYYYTQIKNYSRKITKRTIKKIKEKIKEKIRFSKNQKKKKHMFFFIKSVQYKFKTIKKLFHPWKEQRWIINYIKKKKYRKSKPKNETFMQKWTKYWWTRRKANKTIDEEDCLKRLIKFENTNVYWWKSKSSRFKNYYINIRKGERQFPRLVLTRRRIKEEYQWNKKSFEIKGRNDLL